MGRLVYKTESGVFLYNDPESGLRLEPCDVKATPGAVTAILKRLWEYEELEKYENMPEIPVGVGDIVYRICPKCNKHHSGNCQNCAWESAENGGNCNIYGLWKDGQFPASRCQIVPYIVTWNYIPNLIEHLGETVFRTWDEAEEKLKFLKELEDQK